MAVATIAHIALVAVAAFTLVAVPLAMIGLFRWYLLLPLVAVLAAALYLLDRSVPFALRAGRSSTWFVIGVVIVTTGISLVHPTQHFATNRDAGIYASTGLWLEREGSILFAPPEPEFDGIEGVRPNGAGFYDTREDGRLSPQFAHLTHTMLGTAAMVGDTPLLTRVNVLVGGFGVLLLFVLVQQLARGWAAAIASSAVALALPQIYFSRGPYSEPLSQLLIVGGLALLVSGRTVRPPHALLSGLLLGAAIGSRIDAILLLAALVVVLAAWWLDDRDGGRTAIGWFTAGLAVTTAIGLVDLRFFATQYLTDLWKGFHQAALLAVTLTVLAIALALATTFRDAVWTLIDRHRRLLATSAALLTWFVLLALLFVRPLIPSTGSNERGLIAGLQARQGLDVDATRTYAEQSFQWMTWYLGWPLVLLAIVGAALVAHRLVDRWSWPMFAAVVALGLPTLVYLYRPSIIPDQLWAMRRYVPTGFPLFALLGALAMSALGDRLSLASRPLERALPAAVGALVLLPIAAVSLPYATFREMRLDTDGLEQLCSEIGGDAVLVDETSNLGPQLVPPLAAACDADVAVIATAQLSSSAIVADRFGETNRSLLLLSNDPGLADTLEGVELRGSTTYRVQEIERSVERPPSGTEQPPGSTATVHIYVVD